MSFFVMNDFSSLEFSDLRGMALKYFGVSGRSGRLTTRDFLDTTYEKNIRQSLSRHTSC